MPVSDNFWIMGPRLAPMPPPFPSPSRKPCCKRSINDRGSPLNKSSRAWTAPLPFCSGNRAWSTSRIWSDRGSACAILGSWRSSWKNSSYKRLKWNCSRRLFAKLARSTAANCASSSRSTSLSWLRQSSTSEVEILSPAAREMETNLRMRLTIWNTLHLLNGWDAWKIML